MSRDRPTDHTSTADLADLFGSSTSGPSTGVTLVIYHRGGLDTARLVPTAPLVVGRAAPADVCVADRTLSRTHARFTLMEDRVLVEDLGSTNGTWLAGTRVARAEIAAGGEVMLGTAIARVFGLGPPADASLDDAGSFRRHLDAELARAHAFQRSFALLAVRAGEPESGEGRSGSWAQRLRSFLRTIDHLTLFTPDVALVLLPEVDLERAVHLAREIAAASSGAPRRVGVAAYPLAATHAEKLLDLAREAAERASRAEPVVTAPTGPRLAGASADEGVVRGEELRKLYRTARRAANSQLAILIHGETGTGKELLASYLHEHSPRARRPLVRVNCAALPQSLLESTLFGHEKGAFTGADQRRTGLFEEANGGTLFLDEVGELSSAAQAALLRVMDRGQLQRVGSAQEIEVDVRVIAATHRDLAAMVGEGTFREDLVYRLSTMELELPPLRSRLDEIEPLTRLFLKQGNRDNRRAVRGVSEEAMARLLAYDWPGNVRELRNVILRALVIAEEEDIGPADLPDHVGPARGEGSGGALRAQLKQSAKKKVEDALRKAGWDRAAAAAALGLSLRTLERRMKEFGIRAPRR
jgi:DNA-binding NtrC family response regulator